MTPSRLASVVEVIVRGRQLLRRVRNWLPEASVPEGATLDGRRFDAAADADVVEVVAVERVENFVVAEALEHETGQSQSV